jgi:hypothetical protein
MTMAHRRIACVAILLMVTGCNHASPSASSRASAEIERFHTCARDIAHPPRPILPLTTSDAARDRALRLLQRQNACAIQSGIGGLNADADPALWRVSSSQAPVVNELRYYRTCVDRDVPHGGAQLDRLEYWEYCVRQIPMQGLSPRQIELASGYLVLGWHGGSLAKQRKVLPPGRPVPGNWWTTGCP